MIKEIKNCGDVMGRSKNPTRFASLDVKKLNQSCPHYKECFCLRQHRMCNNKDHFYENCIVYKGNGMLNAFMHKRRAVSKETLLHNEPVVTEEIIASQEVSH